MVTDPFARTVLTLGRLAAEAPDADLLRRFVAGRDDHAFAALVRRHAPMVFGVCRRTLGHVQDAEDAFQAVFLVLARKAHAVRPETLGRWLYGVAVRVASKARARRARRLAASADLDQLPAPAGPPPADWLPLLDAALARLADRDRRPILLCDLLGRSRADAAAELGIAEGTLSSRLARARRKLAGKLARLGVAPAALAAVGLAPDPVPARLIDSTLAAGASAAARELAHGVLRTMTLAKLVPLAALGACIAGAITVGLARVPGAGADPAPPAKETPKDPPPAAKDAPKPSAKPDAERMLGTWVVTSARRDGQREDIQTWTGEVMSFDGERVKFFGFPGPDKRYKLDPGWDQKRIDFEFRKVRDGGGQWKTVAVPAIYRFEGDRLHIVFGVVDLEDRPESFDWQEKGPPFTHIRLKRPTGEVKDLVAEERKALEGNWVGVAAEVGGDRRAIDGVRLEFKDDRFVLRPANDGLPSQGVYALDLTPSPRHLDLTITAGRDGAKGQVVRGIYTRERGVLKVCFDETGGGRPKGFTDAAGRPVMYFVREGQKPPDDLIPKPAATRLRELQKERVQALKQISDANAQNLVLGKGNVLEAVRADEELAAAEMELAGTPEERAKVWEGLVGRLKQHEATAMVRANTADITIADEARVKAARLKAEIELEKAKGGK